MGSSRQLGVVVAAGLLAVAGLGSAGTAQAQGAGEGWYTGFGVAQVRLGFKAADFAIGPAGTASTFDDTNAGYRFFAGYRLNRWFALEGGYDNLGHHRARLTNTSGVAQVEYRPDALRLSGVGSLALGDTGFSAFGKIGFGVSRVRENTANLPPVAGRGEFAARDWRMSPVVGAGVQVQLPRGLALRAEYEQYVEVGEAPMPTGRARAGLWSLSLMYLF
ncbi:MAG: outer membrane beta-barrel protein [Pseudomonadota bacterium]|jgi:OOP family OmpA-OmpF porin